MTQRKSWLRSIKQLDEPTGEAVTVYQRGIADYADDIRNAQHRVTVATSALAQAQEQLSQATAAFIAHCKEADMPIEMEPAQWPTKPYRLED